MTDKHACNFQAYLVKTKELEREAGKTIPLPVTSQEHQETINSYATFLLQVPKHAEIELSLDQIER